MKMKLIFWILGALLIGQVQAQSTPFTISIEPMNISGLGGLQAFAFGQHNGKWLIIGGRLDGLHRRQPWATFDIVGHNTQLIVVDPVAQQRWTAPLTSLSANLAEQLSSTNMEFVQTGDYLYLVGGYGYSATIADHKTYDFLTAVDVPAVIDAIINGGSLPSHFRQIADPQFAVTGGHLNKVYDTYYLVGGQRFDGRYNPMGGPTYTQTYTNQIRKFNIQDNGTTLAVQHLPSITDPTNLHRRDYNVASQIMPNGEQGLTAFSGVFQPTVDLPYLNCVNIDSSGHTVNNAFSQYYNHYHCAYLPLHSQTNNEMHTVFFGGIAQYYDSMGTLVRDDNVPFVHTIARVTRDANGVMAEYKMPVEMPTLLGASAEFIPNESLQWYSNEVLDLDALPTDTTLVGYIYGGIASSDRNIFFVNDGTQSSASSQIFKVYITKSTATGTDALNPHSVDALNMWVSPNPASEHLAIQFDLKEASPVTLTVSDVQGRTHFEKTRTDWPAGHNRWEIDLPMLRKSGTWMISLSTDTRKITQKIVVLD